MSIELRPVRPADRQAMLEVTADIYGGNDYLPRVFDEWVSDPGATFQCVEVDGRVVGFQRMAPVSRDVVYYQGLRVATGHRRQGLARRMLTAAVAQARTMGYRLMRLNSRTAAAIALFVSAGFELEVELDFGFAPAIEGDEPPPLGRAADAERLFRAISADPALAAYNGFYVEGDSIAPLNSSLLAARCELGRVRTGAGGRTVAILTDWHSERTLWVGFLSGSGAALRDLLLALRSEADLGGLQQVGVMIPPSHPGRGDLEQTGYDFDADPVRLGHYALRLNS